MGEAICSHEPHPFDLSIPLLALSADQAGPWSEFIRPYHDTKRMFCDRGHTRMASVVLKHTHEWLTHQHRDQRHV
jgi:hypothetical protein